MTDYPCEECALKEVDIEDLKEQIRKLKEMVDVAETALIRALPTQDTHIALKVARALSSLQKMRS